jgi:hypothetical protein
MKFTGKIDFEKQKQMPRGILAIIPDGKYREKIRQLIMDCKDKDLDIEIKLKSKKRSLSLNNLMWALYEIQANETNAGFLTSHVEKTGLYESDLQQYGKRVRFLINHSDLAIFRSEWKYIENIENAKNDKLIITAVKSSSMFSGKEMYQWIQMLFNRLAIMGTDVTEPDEIKRYWVRFQKKMNNNKIILYEKKIKVSEYKKKNPLCEACGAFIARGGGSLAHIKARGMGGNVEKEKEMPSNWLHLCDPCHAYFDNGKGRDLFLQKYSHLRHKIEKALQKNI